VQKNFDHAAVRSRGPQQTYYHAMISTSTTTIGDSASDEGT
jgi:hypothetical protein